jgi:hypothetical protein
LFATTSTSIPTSPRPPRRQSPRRRREPDLDRRERERILGEHAPRDQTLLEQRLVAKLDEDLQDSPLHGRPLPRRLRNFSHYADRYAISLAGPPAYSRRLRAIEDETAGHEEALRTAWEELAGRYAREPQELTRRWRELAKRWNFSAVNELIEGHNRW